MEPSTAVTIAVEIQWLLRPNTTGDKAKGTKPPSKIESIISCLDLPTARSVPPFTLTEKNND
jgi:hypothetical protein